MDWIQRYITIYLLTVYDLLQLSYAIGVAEPLSIFVSSYGTGIKSDPELLRIISDNFDLRPGRIVKYGFFFGLAHISYDVISWECHEL